MNFAKVYAAGNKADVSDAEVLEHLRRRPRHRGRVLLHGVDRGRARLPRRRAGDHPVQAGAGRQDGPHGGRGARRALPHGRAGRRRGAVGPGARAGGRRGGRQRARADRRRARARLAAGPPRPARRDRHQLGRHRGRAHRHAHRAGPRRPRALRAAAGRARRGAAAVRQPPQPRRRHDRVGPVRRALSARHRPHGPLRRGRRVVAVLLHRAAMDADVVAAVRDAVLGLRDDGVGVPVYVCWVAPAEARPRRGVAARGAHPVLRVAAAHRACRGARGALRAPAPPRPRRPPRRRPRRRACRRSLPGRSGPEAAARLARGFGIDVPEQAVCAGPGHGRRGGGTDRLPGRRQARRRAPLHKSDAGGVRLGLATPPPCAPPRRRCWSSTASAQVLVQPMLTGTEVVVGGLRDPVLGAGRDGRPRRRPRRGAGAMSRSALAPVAEAEAREAIESLRGFGLLDRRARRPQPTSRRSRARSPPRHSSSPRCRTSPSSTSTRCSPVRTARSPSTCGSSARLLPRSQRRGPEYSPGASAPPLRPI